MSAPTTAPGETAEKRSDPPAPLVEVPAGSWYCVLYCGHRALQNVHDGLGVQETLESEPRVLPTPAHLLQGKLDF
jgi:hypothetical protein